MGDGPDHERDVGGERMDRATAEEFLATGGVGVLSLADDGDAYGLPLSYGYDPDRAVVYFLLLRTGERSRKETYLETTDRACLTVYETAGRDDWHSVVARGPTRAVGDDEREAAVEAIDAGAWHPDLFREAAPTRGVRLLALKIEELTGLRGGAAE